MQNILLLVGVLTFSHFGRGIEILTCYVCVTETDGECANPSNPYDVVIGTRHCDGPSCLLYQTSTGYRRCLFVNVMEDNCVPGEKLGYSEGSCVCQCNKSVGLCPSILNCIMLLTISLAFKQNYI
ncbi:uncharacterized protein LOC123559213 [Mercenaria mercenaria]|uniref:uncharacterized protein LOC123559213 n=1 Tax=Mercenaria mercenaria TaxID=6596 RepID=UPI00234F55BC|nr:uncharacterized protein LOC123559213 [Mercenaria mercenaria]